MKIHYLNVGHGDCTLIEHDSGRITMVDINNGDDIDDTSAKEIATETPSRIDDLSLYFANALNVQRKSMLKTAGYEIAVTNPVEYFKRNFSGREISRYIQSHPDLDHMRGINALFNQGIRIRSIWDTVHNKVPSFASDSDRSDWNRYAKLRNGEWFRPGDVLVKRYRRGTQNIYTARQQGNLSDDDGIFVLSPTQETNQSANRSGNSNNLSYVLGIIASGHFVVLGGDAEEDVWKSIHATYGDGIKCSVLKASHHGRDSGYHQPSVKAMSPDYAIVSVGKKPLTDASNKYRAYSKNVWSTRWKGNVVLDIPANGKAIITSEFDR
jgi:competence protein ComEC